ncbi:MAG TPA: tRNA (adenosine(37)-N6)-threonylcarbamoyltransferase complex dimerization subunit type 1 TsaB [Nevskiaceae bacterium]
MRCLAIDSSTEVCSVALEIDGRRRQRIETETRQHSQRLPYMVQELLAEAGVALQGLDRLICCVGPGGFAGVRVGVAYAKGLAFGLDIPVAPVSSLALLAQQAVGEQPGADVVTALDARMQEVYVASWRQAEGSVVRVGSEQVCRPESTRMEEPLREPWIGIGSGWKRYPLALQQAYGTAPSKLLPDAVPKIIDAFHLVQRGQLAFASAMALKPVYLRNHVARTLAERRGEARQPSPEA